MFFQLCEILTFDNFLNNKDIVDTWNPLLKNKLAINLTIKMCYMYIVRSVKIKLLKPNIPTF